MAVKDLFSLAGLVVMALGHIASSKLNMLDSIKQRGWVSFSAGSSVAYVFTHVFPEIGIFQQQIIGHSGHGEHVNFVYQPLYLVALSGLCLLYLMNTIEADFRHPDSHKLQQHKHYMQFFTVKVFFYFLYNVMIAYLITTRPGQGFMNLTLIVAAVTMHFVVFNTTIREVYESLYDIVVRWVASAGLMIGWILGVTTLFPELLIMTVFSFVGGMITYVALKHELPETKHKAPFHFLAGTLLYALIVLAIPFFGRI